MPTRGRRALAAVLLALSSLGLVACGGSDDDEGGGGGGGQAQAPAQIDLWTRQASEGALRPLVQAYNDSHRTKVRMRVIPNDQFVTVFGSAAGARQLPDLVSVDVVYMPRFIESNLFTDLSDRIEALPFAQSLLPAHMKLVSQEGGRYGVPAAVDVSSLFYNRKLFRRAGLDPDKPPATWEEIERASERITRLGKGVKGFYFAGNCPGCNAFTFLPLIWASGGQVIDGTKATFDTPQTREALEFYRRMWESDQVPSSSRTDNGERWIDTFTGDDVGIQPLGSFAIGQFKADHPKLDFGVAPLPGQNGGRSAFAGGDVMGIPAGTKNEDAAWDFMRWYLEERQQVEIVAKNGGLVVRTDLAENRYSKEDERVLLNNQLISVSQTPIAQRYNELFNDANGPWLRTLRSGIFQGDVAGALSRGQQEFERIAASSE